MKAKSKKAVWVTSIFMASLFFSVSSFSDEPQITATRIKDNIFMLSGNGGNITVLTGPDGTFMIDDQYAPNTIAILDTLSSLKITTPKYLFNTHHHGDHTGGNENLGKLNAIIIAHDKVREHLEKGWSVPMFDMKAEPAKKEALPLITYNDEMALHINGLEVRAYYFKNAHTDGDSVVSFGSANVISTGDIFFTKELPFIDELEGGSLKGTIDAVDQIIAMVNDDTKIISGHGPLAKKQDLLAYRSWLETAYKKLTKLKAKGLTADQVVNRKPLEGLEEHENAWIPIDKWIKMVYPILE
jgi:glyoxylase-like metal-dependent hydrolase (beta-lactamase superfamily II)